MGAFVSIALILIVHAAAMTLLIDLIFRLVFSVLSATSGSLASELEADNSL